LISRVRKPKINSASARATINRYVSVDCCVYDMRGSVTAPDHKSLPASTRHIGLRVVRKCGRTEAHSGARRQCDSRLRLTANWNLEHNTAGFADLEVRQCHAISLTVGEKRCSRHPRGARNITGTGPDPDWEIFRQFHRTGPPQI